MFSEEFRQWSESAFRESCRAQLDCVGLAGVILPRQSIIGFGQSHACRPDRPTSDMIASLRWRPSGDYRTLRARRERRFRVVIELPSQVLAGTPGRELRRYLPICPMRLRSFLRRTGVLDTAVRMMICTISVTIALTVCTYHLANVILSVRSESALASICTIPTFSPLCPDTRFSVSSPLPYLDRAPLWTDFPDILDEECKTLELMFDEVVEGPGFALEMKKAETVMNEFATLARVCNLNGCEVLSEFLKRAQKVCHGLTRLRSRTGFAVDK